MAIWEVIVGAQPTHYADLPLARAWLAEATKRSSATVQSAVHSAGPDAQAAATASAWSALGSFYRALNMRPPIDPVYRGVYTQAYGIGPSSHVSPISYRARGTLVDRARNAYMTRHAGTAYVQNALVRLWLSDQGIVGKNCVNFNDPGCPFADVFGAGRAIDGGGDCSDSTQWICTAWSDSSDPPLIAPPLVGSLELVRATVLAIAARYGSPSVARLGEMVNSAVSMNGGHDVSIGGEGVMPAVSVGDPQGFVRASWSPATGTAIGTRARLGTVNTGTARAAVSGPTAGPTAGPTLNLHGLGGRSAPGSSPPPAPSDVGLIPPGPPSDGSSPISPEETPQTALVASTGLTPAQLAIGVVAIAAVGGAIYWYTSAPKTKHKARRNPRRGRRRHGGR